MRSRRRVVVGLVIGLAFGVALAPGALGQYLEGLFEDEPPPPTPSWSALFGAGVVDDASNDPASRAGAPGPPVPVNPDPAPQLALAEPDYGNVPEAQVRLAAAVLEFTAPPLQLTTEEAESMVAQAEDRLEAVLALTGATLSPGDLLGAAEQLGLGAAADPDASTSELIRALELDLAAMRSAAAEHLLPTLLTFGLEPDGDDPDALADAIREALGRLGKPVPPDRSLNLDDVRWLNALAKVEDAAARWGVAPVSAQLPELRWATQAERAEAVARGRGAGGPVTTQVRQLGPGGVLYRITGGTPGAPLQGWLVVFDPQRAEVRTTSSSTLGSLATVATAAQRTGALVAVNGGFWLGRGDPDGLLVNGDTMLSDTTAWVRYARNQRAGFGILPDGTPLVGVPAWDARVEMDGAPGIPVRGVNRLPTDDDAVLLTSSSNMTIPDVDGIVLVVRGTRLMVGGERSLEVVRAGRTDEVGRRLEPGTMALVATGRYATRADVMLDRVVAGQSSEVLLRAEVGPGWSGATTALAAGPLTLVDGMPTSPAQWRSEGFDANHTDRRHPRTALGFDDAGVGYLMVLDGRQPSWSVGATQVETARLMRAFGATNALQLDGGGSSTLVIEGQMVNRPCCDGGVRPVASVVLID